MKNSPCLTEKLISLTALNRLATADAEKFGQVLNIEHGISQRLRNDSEFFIKGSTP